MPAAISSCFPATVVSNVETVELSAFPASAVSTAPLVTKFGEAAVTVVSTASEPTVPAVPL